MKQLAIALAAILSCCLPSLAFTANSSPGSVYLSHPVTDLLVEVKHKKHKNNSDGNQDDAGNNSDGNQDDAGLSSCTIELSGGGGGCGGGLKRVCKTIGGKKCCGCVPDKNAKPVEARICCTAWPGAVGAAGGISFCVLEALGVQFAQQQAASRLFDGKPPANVTCDPAK